MRLRFAKNKKFMITAIILSILFILGDAGVLFLSQEKFGHIPRGKRLERIKQSPNYDGKQLVIEMFKGTKYPVEKPVELDWWDSANQGEGFKVTATPARLFSGRGIRSNKTLWKSARPAKNLI